MARNITMNQLTEGIRERHLGTERNRLMEKWNRTGLLRGMNDYGRETMSQLLENQAAQLLREANTLGSSGADSGQIDGFSNIAFPIVRRVFGGLIANDLVSIQPMSLPSGLLFYLDYTYGQDVGGDTDRVKAGANKGDANPAGAKEGATASTSDNFDDDFDDDDDDEGESAAITAGDKGAVGASASDNFDDEFDDDESESVARNAGGKGAGGATGINYVVGVVGAGLDIKRCHTLFSHPIE